MSYELTQKASDAVEAQVKEVLQAEMAELMSKMSDGKMDFTEVMAYYPKREAELRQQFAKTRLETHDWKQWIFSDQISIINADSEVVGKQQVAYTCARCKKMGSVLNSTKEGRDADIAKLNAVFGKCGEDDDE